METTQVTLQYRRAAGRLGWALLVFFLSTQAMQWATVALIGIFWPGFAASPFYLALVTDLPLYGVGAPLFLLMLRKLPSAPAPQPRAAMTPGFFARVLCMAFCVMYAANFLSLPITLLTNWLAGGQNTNPLVEVIGGSSAWVNVFFLCLVPAVMEELLFRGVLRRKLGCFGDKAFILVSGLCFGLFHGNLAQFFYAAALGILLAWLYCRTGQLRWCMLVHLAINLMGSVVAVKASETVPGSLALVAFVLAMLLAGFVLLLLERGRGGFALPAREGDVAHPVRTAFSTAGLIAFTLLCAASALLVVAVSAL